MYLPHVLSVFANTHKCFPTTSVYNFAFDIYNPRRTVSPIYGELLNVRGVYFDSIATTLGDGQFP